VRRVRYGVGISLDGFIAGPAGELDFLVGDPAYDQRAFFASVDTVVMGRRTYEAALRHGARGFPGMRAFVFSRTLPQAQHGEVTVVADDGAEVLRRLRAEDGPKDIWLAGGGALLASLLPAGVVDTIEVGISPVLVGQPGVPMLAPTPPLPHHVRLELIQSRAYQSGLLVAEYAVRLSAAGEPAA